jgi:hypothetical protein
MLIACPEQLRAKARGAIRKEITNIRLNARETLYIIKIIKRR